MLYYLSTSRAPQIGDDHVTNQVEFPIFPEMRKFLTLNFDPSNLNNPRQSQFIYVSAPEIGDDHVANQVGVGFFAGDAEGTRLEHFVQPLLRERLAIQLREHQIVRRLQELAPVAQERLQLRGMQSAQSDSPLFLGRKECHSPESRGRHSSYLGSFTPPARVHMQGFQGLFSIFCTEFPAPRGRRGARWPWAGARRRSGRSYNRPPGDESPTYRLP